MGGRRKMLFELRRCPHKEGCSNTKAAQWVKIFFFDLSPKGLRRCDFVGY
jgi:hypothetical protein